MKILQDYPRSYRFQDYAFHLFVYGSIDIDYIVKIYHIDVSTAYRDLFDFSVNLATINNNFELMKCGYKYYLVLNGVPVRGIGNSYNIC